MREYKFRGKEVVCQEWVYGGYYNTDDRRKGEKIHFIRGETEHFRVIPESVGQFTGLRDKNGTEIYEGDVLKYYSDARMLVPTKDGGWVLEGNPRIEEKTKVVYSEELGAYTVHGESMYLFEINDKSEVIGNIHENPELTPQ